MDADDVDELTECIEMCKRFGWKIKTDDGYIMVVEDSDHNKMIVKASTIVNIHFFLLGHEHSNG